MKELVVLSLVMLTACGGSGGSSTSDAKSNLISAWTEGYEQTQLPSAVSDAQSLEASIASYCVDKASAAKAETQSAWKKLNATWQAARVLNSHTFTEEPQTLGSVSLATRIHTGHEFETQNGAAAVDHYIADTNLVTDLFNANANLQGLPALEYILFTNALNETDACVAAKSIASNLTYSLTVLAQNWHEQSADFKAPAETIGGFTSRLDVIEDFLNGIYAYVREINRYKLEQPLGFADSTLKPESAESFRSEQSLATLQQNYAGLNYLFFETQHNLETLLYSVGANALVAELEGIMQKINADLAQIDTEVQNVDIEQAQGSQYQIYKSLYTSSQRLAILFDEQIISTIGATTNFNKTDGD